MKTEAIIYTSNTGHTAAYAKLLGEKTDLPVYTLSEAKKQLEPGAPIVYLGWLFANSIKGYKKAAKKYTVCAVCGVGLCETGTLLEEVRKANALADSIPLFTLQGGMDRTKLHGVYKMMINMLTKGLSEKAQRSEQEEKMLILLQEGGNYVSEENLFAVLDWCQNERNT